MDPSDDKLREIRLQLRSAKPSDDINPLIRDIQELGHAGSVLIPELIEAIDQGRGYPAPLVLVPLIVQHKSTPLLAAAMKAWGDRGLAVHDKAALFRAGFTQFQSELLDYLRDSFDNDYDPGRLAIVEAFAESGTTSLTQDLEDIECWCARRLRELETDDPDLSEEQRFLRALEGGSREEFLTKLRSAIPRVRNRQDLPLTQSSGPPPEVVVEHENPEQIGEAATHCEPVIEPETHQISIHPEVARHAQSLLASGNYFHAVFEAAKAYDKAVATLAKSNKHGTELMFDALSKKGLVKITPCNSDTDLNVQEGTMHLSVGLMRVVRNPTAHEPAIDWPMSKQDALDLLALISFLFRQLDKATNPDGGSA